MDFLTSYVIPGVIAAAAIIYANYFTNQFQNVSLDNQDKIKDLTTEIEKIAKQNKEILDKVDSTVDENLEIDKRLDIIISDIEKITSRTESMALDIKDEQKVKGNIALRLPVEDEYYFKVGSNYFPAKKEILESKEGFNPIEINGTNVFKVKLVDGELLLNLKLYDLQGHLITEIEDSKWAVGNSFFSKNWNEKALEVLDKRGNVALQISFYGNIIIIKGILPTPTEVQIFDDNTVIPLLYDDTEFFQKFIKHSSSLRRIFKHSGSNYLGKRVPLNAEEKAKIEQLIQDKKQESLKLEKLDEIYRKYKNKSDKELNEIGIGLVKSLNVLYSKYRNLTKLEFNEMMSDKNMALREEYEQNFKVQVKSIKRVLLEKVQEDGNYYFHYFKNFDSELVNLISLENIIDKLEYFSKKILIQGKVYDKQILITQGEQMIFDIESLINKNDSLRQKKEKKLDKLIQASPSRKEANEIFVRKRDLYRQDESIALYNSKFKIDAVLLSEEILKLIPNHKPNKNTIYNYFPNNPLGIMQLINELKTLTYELKKV